MNADSEKPEWARYLPHGLGILLLATCRLEGTHRAHATTVLQDTPLGATMPSWPTLWGLEILAQAAAALPVQGRVDGPRQGYLVKADKVRYCVATLPVADPLSITIQRTAESSVGINICEGMITTLAQPDRRLLEARFYLWNKAA